MLPAGVRAAGGPSPPRGWSGSRTTGADGFRKAAVWLLAITAGTLPLVFSTRSYDQFELPQVLLLRIAVALMVLCWASCVVLSRRPERGLMPLELAVSAWCVWLLLRTVFSAAPAVSWRGAYENFDGFLTQLLYMAVFLLAARLVEGPAEAGRILLGGVASSIAASVYALCQVAGLDFQRWSLSFAVESRHAATLGNPLVLGTLVTMTVPLAPGLLFSSGGRRLKRILVLTGLSIPTASAVWLALYAASGGGILAGSREAGRAGILALGVLAAAASLGVIQTLLALRRRPGAARLAGLGAMWLLLATALLVSGSRGAILGLFVSALFALALGVVAARGAGRAPSLSIRRVKPLRFAAAASIALAIVAVAAAAGAGGLGRFAEAVAHPLRVIGESRLFIWEAALAMWRDRPLGGWGVDTFRTVFPAFETAARSSHYMAGQIPQTAHSEPLQILATAGAVGLGLWMGIIGSWLHRLFRGCRGGGDPRASVLLIALGAAGVGYLTASALSVTAVTVKLLFWLAMGLTCALAAGAREGGETAGGGEGRGRGEERERGRVEGRGRGEERGRVEGRGRGEERERGRGEERGKGEERGRGEERGKEGGSGTGAGRSLAAWALPCLVPAAIALVGASAWSARREYLADVRHASGARGLEQSRDLASRPAPELAAAIAAGIPGLSAKGVGGDPLLLAERRALREACAALLLGGVNGADTQQRLHGMYAALAARSLLLPAVAEQEEAVRLAPAEARYHWLLGELYADLYRWTEAPASRQRFLERGSRAYRRATELEPPDPYAWAGAGRLWYLAFVAGREGEAYRASRDAYAQAIRRGPLTREFTEDLISLELVAGKPRAALEAAAGALRSDPAFGGGLLVGLADRLMGTGGFRSASEDPSAAAARAVALEALEKAQAALPGRPDIPHKRALIHCLEGRDSACRSALDEALRIDPGYGPALELRRLRGW